MFVEGWVDVVGKVGEGVVSFVVRVGELELALSLGLSMVRVGLLEVGRRRRRDGRAFKTAQEF